MFYCGSSKFQHHSDIQVNVIYKRGIIVPKGVAENENNKTIRTYPNPANGNVTVDLTSLEGNQATVKLTDVMGRTVDVFAANGERIILLARQAPGNYFVEVTDENKNVYTTRIVFIKRSATIFTMLSSFNSP